ncbi:MAG: GIY-YIG nuclease family protein [Bacilli bacterium]|uniref:GIY-YIG nuclease family protein n=1 Tax=Clostridium sp. TaxID=1506 RepID=UPI002FC596C3
MHKIYKIVNKLNDKTYIGETSKSLSKRFNDHRNYSIRKDRKGKLYDAMNLYGLENFYIELIEECSYEERHDREEYWITKYDSFKNGYNSAPRQYCTSLGKKKTQEQKEHLSKMSKGLNNPMFGKDVKNYMSEEKIKEWKSNMSKARKGNKFTEEHKKKLSENSGRSKMVLQLNEDKVEVNRYPTLTKASKENNIPLTTLHKRIKSGEIIKNHYYIYANNEKM